MKSDGVFIRGLDPALIEEIKHILIRQHGTYYGYQARVINEALDMWLERKRQQSTTLTISPSELRPDVAARIDNMKLALMDYVEENPTGNIPVKALEDVIRRQVGDNRSVKAYLQRLIRLDYVDPVSTKVWRISPKWIQSLVEQKQEAGKV